MNARTARDVRQSTPRRYLALSFPFLPIDRLRITRPDLWARGEGPAVVVERLRGATRLSCVDADGHAMGLVPGMALDDARAIASDRSGRLMGIRSWRSLADRMFGLT